MDYEDRDDDLTSQEIFFEKAILVLFDLPVRLTLRPNTVTRREQFAELGCVFNGAQDFSIVSAYVLLGLVWVEAFLQSRRHWLSAVEFRRKMLIGYLVFNMCLYGAQMTLYLLLFLPSIDEVRLICCVRV